MRCLNICREATHNCVTLLMCLVEWDEKGGELSCRVDSRRGPSLSAWQLKVGLLMGWTWSRWIGKQRFNLSHWRFQWSLLMCLHSGMSIGEVGRRIICTNTTPYCTAKQTWRIVHGSTQPTVTIASLLLTSFKGLEWWCTSIVTSGSKMLY